MSEDVFGEDLSHVYDVAEPVETPLSAFERCSHREPVGGAGTAIVDLDVSDLVEVGFAKLRRPVEVDTLGEDEDAVAKVGSGELLAVGFADEKLSGQAEASDDVDAGSRVGREDEVMDVVVDLLR